MRLGNKTAIVFSARMIGSALTFFTTIYLARLLGAEALGVYTLLLTVLAWVKLGGFMGVGSGIKKRVSEGEEQGAFFTSGLIMVLVFGVAISILLFVLSGTLDAYINEFDTYVGVSVVWVLVPLLIINLWYNTLLKAIEGENKVHIAAILEPIKYGFRGVLQVGLLFVGFGLTGMIAGYAAGGIFVGVIALLYVTVPFRRPAIRHFKSIYDYAKYAWLGGLKSRSFNDVDILVLGVFVGEALIGVYAAAWSLARFLNLFGGALSSTLFPEISRLSKQKETDAVSGLVEDALTFAGLIVLPGLVGGLLLGDRLLAVYGPEFVEGTTVFGLLLLAVLVYGYQKQLLNALNAVDRPDIAFRINAAFIAANASLNVALIWRYGIVGAAIATAASAVLGVTASYVALGRLLEFETPLGEIARQLLAAGVMGIAVHATRTAGEGTALSAINELFVALLVALGAGVYFLVLLAISSTFRDVVRRNLPVDLPTL